VDHRRLVRSERRFGADAHVVRPYDLGITVERAGRRVMLRVDIGDLIIPFGVQKILNHVESGVTAVYDAIVSGKGRSKVLAFKARA
jgi:hypothetical protein